MYDEFDDAPPEPIIDRATAPGENLLVHAGKYMFEGPRMTEEANNLRLQKFIQAAKHIGVDANSIVTHIHNALSPGKLPLRSCGAEHEHLGPFCPVHASFGNNIGCLHAGGTPLRVANEFLHAWKLLPAIAAHCHRQSIRRSDEIALDGNHTLDSIAARLWMHERNPAEHSEWQQRFMDVGTFREEIRAALLRVCPHPHIMHKITYVRDAVLLSMRRPSLITAEEKELMLA